MIALTIPEPTPSVNVFHGRHWSRKLRERQKWGWLVRAARLQAHVLPSHPDFVRMRIERFGARILDRDNFIAGAKWLIDALVAEGFASDDSPEHLIVEYTQKVGKPHRTIIEVSTP